MRPALILLMCVLLLASDVLFFLFLFRRKQFLTLGRGLFIKRELLVIPLFWIAIYLPFIDNLFRKPIIEPIHGYSALFFSICVVSIYPIILFTRDYTTKTKVLGVILCLVSIILCLAALSGMMWTDLRF